jgi:hypothetical protein
LTAGERPVVASDDFLDDLDRQLPGERGPRGEPSAADFLAIEAPDIVRTFAHEFEALPPLVEGRRDYRVLIGRGTVVRAFAVTAQLRQDGWIELLALELDP